MSSISNPEDFAALDPFFRIIERGLSGLADGAHFFDLLADEVVFEYVITVPGYPRRVEGRDAIIELYRPYGQGIVLDSCGDLAVHYDPDTGTAVLEYSSSGKSVITGGDYKNNYISVIKLIDRKVAHWRDYLDPLPALAAFGTDLSALTRTEPRG